MFVIRVSKFHKTNSDHLEKRNVRHAINEQTFETILTRFWKPNLPEKLNGEHCEKMTIKTVVIHIPIPNYSLFGEFQIVGPNLVKRRNNKNCKK